MGFKPSDPGRVGWTFLSNHANVLLVIARSPEATLREVAGLVGITERAVQRIVADLEEGRYLERTRNGRRNRYKVHPELPLRHPITAHQDIGALIRLVTKPGSNDSISPLALAIPMPTRSQPSFPAEVLEATADLVVESGTQEKS